MSDSQYDTILTVSESFQVSLGVVLLVVVIFRLAIVAVMLKHRKKSALQLAQSSVLAVHVLVGAFAIGSCYLLLPLNDTHCLLRDPFIFTPLTVCGNILLGRIWRIILLMSPVLEERCGKKQRYKQKILKALSVLADCDPLRYYCWSKKKRGSSWRGGGRKRITDSSRSLNRCTLRRKVTISRLLWLVFLLSLPQFLFQVCHLLIPQLKGSLVVAPVDNNLWYIGRTECQNGQGQWLTWVGVLLVVVPYCMAAYVSLQSSVDLPKVFDETRAVWASTKVVFLVVAVAGPAMPMVETLNGRTYLCVCIVCSFAMAPIWYLVYPKLYSTLKKGGGKRIKMSQVLVRKTRPTALDLAFSRRRAENDHEKTAKLALMIGKMYEDMGLVHKSLSLFDDALAVWQVDPARDKKPKIGNFTADEISSFSPMDLQYIMQLLIAKGRVEGTFHSAVDAGQKSAAQAWLDALEIYEQCPASIDMPDRSIIFPIFSGLFVFLKGGKIQQDSDSHFEQNLARKFVRETKIHGDPIHYTRALAMQCEVKARLGKYETALESFEILKSIYDPAEHSEGIASQYGTDRSGQAFSQVALWYMQLGRMDEALEACENVVNCLIPLMDPANVLNMCELLLPVIRILKPRGQALRMKQLFQEQVVCNFDKHFGKDGVTPCLPIFKPLTMLLDICHDQDGFPNLADAVEWLVDEKKCCLPDFLDSVYTKLCWSPYGMVAELCLRVAYRLKTLNGSDNDCREIVKRGLQLARKAEKKMKDARGQIILPIAYEIHVPVIEGLESLAVELDLAVEDDRDSTTLSRGSNTNSAPDLKNLPASYMKTNSDRSIASLSTGSVGSCRPSSSSLAVTRGSSFDSDNGSAPPCLRPAVASAPFFVEAVAEHSDEDCDPTIEHGDDGFVQQAAGTSPGLGSPTTKV